MATTSESRMLSSSSFSSSSSSSKSYEVFLSFYGKDTRGNITDHLYNGLVRAGIRTFRDNEELRHGDEIGPVLMKAIQESKISIPVFSENYAFSKWCLKELAKIMECKKNDGQIVWPIFYKVDPSHIRNQTGNFAEAFLQHQENQAKETIDSWRNALKDAGNLKGWDSQSPENSLESDLIRSVVVDVLSELKKTTALDVGNHIIGMDSRVDDVIRLLDLESKDVQYVGICGMGGLGKSTIAKAVFNKISCHFKGWSFLEDVSSTSQREGLVKLQNKLVYDIRGLNSNFHSVAKGINIIKERCSNKKVLIILDNVDSDEQLDALARERNWFGLGSRIIITSRDRQILNVTHVDDTKIYMPEVLNEKQSLELFCNYAFREDQPLHNFLELSEKIVRSAGGLPLALRVLGSHLCRKINVEEWESELKRLNKIPRIEVQEVLKISFDSLLEYDKEIFLDIACFFIGMDKEIVIHILEDYFPAVGIKDLVLKSLVSIDDNNMLRMHDLLRDMGREIVRQKSPKNVGERTRLWSRGDALDVLKEGKGTSSIEGLSLVRDDDPVSDVSDSEDDPVNYASDFAKTDHCLKNEAFKPMSDLRLLQVDGAYFDGNFDALSTKLKWLSWKGIPSECILSISHLTKLSVLDLSESKITEDWNGWQHIQKVKTLKVLDLGGCRSLTRTPDFSYNTGLQRLILDGCWSLVACDESIGCLKKLVYLTLKYCRNIKELPDSICKLSSLTNLILSYCPKLEKLPKALGDMKSLTELMIDMTDIEELPDSIGSLEKLVSLSAKYCKNIKELPDSICKLSSLTNLILSDCWRLEKLPKALGDMKSLTELIIDKTGIEELPDSFGSLEKLVSLSAKYCLKLARIPHSMGKLRRLQYINLLGSRNIELPEGFGNLWSLKTLKMGTRLENLILFALNAMECYSLESLPNMSNFKSLERLRVYDSEKLAKIQDLNGLSLLQELVLTNCKMLQSLPELPSSLIRLNIRYCSSVESLPNLSNLKILEEIHLFNCEKLTEIEGLNGLSLLQKLDFRNCQMLQSLPELPPTLTRLHIEGCKSMESLPNLSNLKILERLCLNHCGKLAKIEGMGGLSLLKQLDLQACVMLQSLPELPPSLIIIDIRYCKSMERLANLSSLKILKHLYLDNCEKLIKIEGLTSLSLLPPLDLTNCKMLQSLPELPSILTKLRVRGCMKLSEIEGIIGLSLLKVLHLYDCRELRSLPDLSNLKKLEELLLEHCDNLVDIRGLESLESLKYFHVIRCNTYIKTLQKCVAQGMPVVGAFQGGNINKIYQIPDNDENIKGMGLRLVYQTPLQLLGKPIHLKVEAEIKRNDGERIQCCHDLQIEGMTGTDVDGYYSCYFHGLTWFGLPLRKQYLIKVTELGYLPEEPHEVVDEFRINESFSFQNYRRDRIHQFKKLPSRPEGSHQEANEVRIKMFVIIPEYETIEDSQQLEKRIAPLITCTSLESEAVGKDKKPVDDADLSTCSQQRGVQRGNKRDDDADPSTCSQQREGVQRGNKRKGFSLLCSFNSCFRLNN